MKSGQGGKKGAGMEREVCRKLSMWVTNGDRDDVFWRSAMSGGRAAIGLKSGKLREAQVGDVSAVHGRGIAFLKAFLVEIKFYKNLRVESLIYGLPKTGSLIQFWAQLVKDSSTYCKYPMLIAKQNMKPTLLIIDVTAYNSCSVLVSGIQALLVEDVTTGKTNEKWGMKSMVIMDFNEFLEKSDPENL